MERIETELTRAMLAARDGESRAYAVALTLVAAAARARIARRVGRSHLELEDIVQEVLVSVHAKSHTWDERRPILPWVNAICDHKSVDCLRRRGRETRFFADNADLVNVAAPALMSEPFTDAVLDRAIASLPPGQTAVVQAIGMRGHTIASTAATLAMTEGAVRVAFHRGLKALRAIAVALDAGQSFKQGPAP